MLTLVIPAIDAFDDEQQLFVTIAEEVTLELEHSLVSLSKWEAVWEKPFLSTDERTVEETLGYIQAMCLTPDVPSDVYQRLLGSHVDQVNEYIAAKMSATWFTERPGTGTKQPKQIITAEILYYKMISFNIPFECQHWHLNRLFSLIKVCNQMNAPEKQQGINKRDMVAERNRINAERKAKYGTTG